MMKILFIIPPYITTDKLIKLLYPMPLGVLSMCGYLRKLGYEADIKDFVAVDQSRSATKPACFEGKGSPPYIHYGYDFEYIENWIKDNIDKYDIIGVSSLQAPVFEGTYKTIEILKKYSGDKLIIAGGPNASTGPDKFLKDTGVNSIVIGEGELAWVKILEDYKNGEVKERYKEDVIENLDDLPIPAWDLINFDDYPHREGKKRVVIDTSRSCPYACRFCSVHTVWGRKWRAHSPEYIIKHIYELCTKFDIKDITFIDDNFLLNKKRALSILNGIKGMRKRKLIKGITFMFEEGMQVTHAMDRELVRALKEAGFVDVRLGLESLNPATLAYVDKPLKVEEFTEAFKVLEEEGYEPRLFYILGFRTDSVKTMIDNMMTLSTFKAKIRANNLKIYPYTDIYKEYLKDGIIDSDFDWRLGTFYTPPVNDFTMKEIKSLKGILNLIEFGSDEGVNIFFDSVEKITALYKKYGMNINFDGIKRELRISGIENTKKFWRVESKFRSLNRLLAVRFGLLNTNCKADGDDLVVKDMDKESYFNKCLYEVLNEKNLLF